MESVYIEDDSIIAQSTSYKGLPFHMTYFCTELQVVYTIFKQEGIRCFYQMDSM